MPPTPARPGVVGRHHQPQGRLSGGMPSPLARMIATTLFTSQPGNDLYNQHAIDLEARLPKLGLRHPCNRQAMNASGSKVVCVHERMALVQGCAETANYRPGIVRTVSRHQQHIDRQIPVRAPEPDAMHCHPLQ